MGVERFGFDGTNGDAVPAPWLTSFGGPTGTNSINSNRMKLLTGVVGIGSYLASARSDFNRVFAGGEILVRVTPSQAWTNTGYLRVGFGSGWASDNTNGYVDGFYCEMAAGPGGAGQAQGITPGSFAGGVQAAGTLVPVAFSGSAAYWLRLRQVGPYLQAKTWQDGTVEPAAWTATMTCTSLPTVPLHLAIGVNIGGQGTAVGFEFDQLSVDDLLFDFDALFQEANSIENSRTLWLGTGAADAGVTVGAGTKKKATLHSPVGGASTQVVKVSAAGPTAPLQTTDGAATTDGTAISWYTDPLQAVTIAGAASWAFWTQEDAAAANIGVAIKVERCSGDGTVLSTIIDPATSQGAGESPTTAAASAGSISAANVTDTTLANGDRLRITIWIDDAAGQGGTGSMASGHWGKAWYGAPSGQGLASLLFTEVLTVYTATTSRTGQLQVRVGGTFVHKPTLVRVGGTFVAKPVEVRVGGAFQNAT